MNQQIKNDNARIYSFPGATSQQLLHYLDVNLDKYTDTVVSERHETLSCKKVVFLYPKTYSLRSGSMIY